MRDEACTFSLGVPTVWLGFFQYIDQHRASLDLKQIRLQRVVIGGSAAPRSIIERFEHELGVYVIQAWGMTETGPLSTIGNLLPRHDGQPLERRFDVQCRQGRAIFALTDGATASLVREAGIGIATDRAGLEQALLDFVAAWERDGLATYREGLEAARHRYAAAALADGVLALITEEPH